MARQIVINDSLTVNPSNYEDEGISHIKQG